MFFKKPQNHKKIYLAVGLAALLGVYFWIWKSERDMRLNANKTCEPQKMEKIVEGNSMEPLLKNNSKVIFWENYYKCGDPVEKGDVVAYLYAGEKHPLIKVVQATEQDEVEIDGDKLLVNGDVLTNSADQEYVFKEFELKMLKIYIKDKHIPAGSYLIFGDNVKNSTDSRKFGAVSSADFLGKFEL